MTRYSVGYGLLDRVLWGSEVIVEAKSKEEAVREFFDCIIDELNSLDCKDVVLKEDDYISEEQE